MRCVHRGVPDPAKDATIVRRSPFPVLPGAVYTRRPARPRADGNIAPPGADPPTVLSSVLTRDLGSQLTNRSRALVQAGSMLARLAAEEHDDRRSRHSPSPDETAIELEAVARRQ